MVKQVSSNSLDLSGFWTSDFILSHQLKSNLYSSGKISDILISLWNSTSVPNGNNETLDLAGLAGFLRTSETKKEQIFSQIKSKLQVRGDESVITFLNKFRNTDILKTIYHNFMTVSSQNKLGFTDGDLIQFAINVSEQSGAKFTLDLEQVKNIYKEQISPLLSSLDFSNESKSVFRDISHIYNEIFKLAKSCGLLYTWNSGNVQESLDSLFTFTNSSFYPTKDFTILMDENPKNSALLIRVFNQWESSNFSSNLVRQERQALYNSRILSNNYTKNALIGYRQFHKVLPVTQEIQEIETSETIKNTQTSRFLKNILSLIGAYDTKSSGSNKLLSSSISGLSHFLQYISKISSSELFKEPKAYEEAVLSICTKLVNIPQVKSLLVPQNTQDLDFSDAIYSEVRKKITSEKNINSEVKLAFWNVLWLTDCLRFYQILFSILPLGARTEEDFKLILSDESKLSRYKKLVDIYISKSDSFEYYGPNGKLSRGISYVPSPANLDSNVKELYDKFSSLFSGKSISTESLEEFFLQSSDALNYLSSIRR